MIRKGSTVRNCGFTIHLYRILAISRKRQPWLQWNTNRTLCDLLSSTIFDDIELPLTAVSRSLFKRRISQNCTRWGQLQWNTIRSRIVRGLLCNKHNAPLTMSSKITNWGSWPAPLKGHTELHDS